MSIKLYTCIVANWHTFGTAKTFCCIYLIHVLHQKLTEFHTCNGEVSCIHFASNIGDIRVLICPTKSVVHNFSQNIKFYRVLANAIK